jgi:predicted Ser/Thr protein kinase
MSASERRNTNVRLLACLCTPDEDDTADSDYRFLVDGQHVKYVTTAPDIFSGADEEDRTWEPVLLGKLLPPFPPGDWNQGHVVKDPNTEQVVFDTVEKVDFPGVKNVWHPTQLNEVDFTREEEFRQRVSVATHPSLNNGKPVVIKFAIWPWEIPFLDVETSVYEMISKCGIGPEFFGHIREGKEGRVIGFAYEWVQGARHAGPDDFESCKEALGRLHKLGIKFGDINKHNFLVREGHNTVLIDFEFAKQKCSAGELEEEMTSLKSSLRDPSSRGGVEIIPAEEST